MCGIKVNAEGSREGLYLVWKDDVSINLRIFLKNHIDVLVKDDHNDKEWRFTDFYGASSIIDRNDTWNLLRRLRQDHNYPWLVSGYFNKILFSFGKVGGIPWEER